MPGEISNSTHPMIYRTYTPQPPLAAFVDVFGLYEGYNPPHAKERRLPDGSMEPVINLREDMFRIYNRQNHNQYHSYRGCMISGTQSEFIVIDTACQSSIMGIAFSGLNPGAYLAQRGEHPNHVSLPDEGLFLQYASS